MLKFKADWLDHPVIFLLLITMGVVSLIGVGSWMFSSLGWGGPLGLLKGGVK